MQQLTAQVTADQMAAFPAVAGQCALGPASQGGPGLAIQVYNATVNLQLYYFKDERRPQMGTTPTPVFGFAPGAQFYPGCVGFTAQSFKAGILATVFAQLYERSDGPVPSAPAAITATLSPGGTFAGTSLPNFSNALGADVAMVNANQFYDGPQVALGVGTWLVIGKVFVDYGGGNDVTAKLWDGATNYSSAEFKRSGNTAAPLATLTVLAIVVLAAGATLRVAAACDVAGQTIKAAAEHNPAGNNASNIVAVQIA